MSTTTARLVALAALLAAPPALAVVQHYSTRAEFLAAAPGLPVDSFGATLAYSAYPLDYYFHSRPVNAATNDSLLPSGSILPGLTIDALQPLNTPQALKLEPIAGGNQIGTGTFGDTLVLTFSPPVAAAGFDLLGHVYSHPLFDGNVEVSVYSGTTLLDYTNPLVPGGSTFVGVVSAAANITQVTLLFNPANDESDTNTFIANLAFGSPHPCGSADFNGDGDVGTDADIEAFFACLAGSCCATCDPHGADFNGDGDVGTDADIEAFFRVLAGGTC
jgi:hypothetical protein